MTHSLSKKYATFSDRRFATIDPQLKSVANMWDQHLYNFLCDLTAEIGHYLKQNHTHMQTIFVFIFYLMKSVALAGRCCHHPARFRHRNMNMIR